MVDQTALRLVNFVTQRFASSSFHQWIKIYKSYGSYCKVFNQIHPNREGDEEWQCMIKDSDYVRDLLAMIDIMEPLRTLMLLMQSLVCPIWKLKKIYPVVKNRLL